LAGKLKRKKTRKKNKNKKSAQQFDGDFPIDVFIKNLLTGA
jgi:hypothetical protein